MSQPRPPSQEEPKGDPWHAFGYLTSGVATYGVLGWLADRWLGTSFLVAVGIILGAGLGIYMTFSRFNKSLPSPGAAPPPTDRTEPHGPPGPKGSHGPPGPPGPNDRLEHD